MAKIDSVIASVITGFKTPEWRAGSGWIPDEQMEQLQVRRKVKGAAHHCLTYFSVGEQGQQPTATFWGHKLSDCLKKALEWRGLPTKKTRGPRQAPGAQQ